MKRHTANYWLCANKSEMRSLPLQSIASHAGHDPHERTARNRAGETMTCGLRRVPWRVIDTRMIAATLLKRACGDCTLCCKLMAIDELEKPVGSWCQNCKAGSGCKIYAERPTEWRTFNCLWLIDERLGLLWKPNKSKVVLTTAEDGTEIRCDPGFSDAWLKEPFRSQRYKWAEAGELSDVTVVIVGAKNDARHDAQ